MSYEFFPGADFTTLDFMTLDFMTEQDWFVVLPRNDVLSIHQKNFQLPASNFQLPAKSYQLTATNKKSPPKLEGSILNYVINLFFMQQHRFDGWTLGYDQHVVAHLVICSDVDGVNQGYWHGLFFN